MITLLTLNVLLTGFMGMVWSCKNWINLSYKFVFLGLFFANIFYLVQSLGYIVKV